MAFRTHDKDGVTQLLSISTYEVNSSGERLATLINRSSKAFLW
jgi:hypothetical protein